MTDPLTWLMALAKLISEIIASTASNDDAELIEAHSPDAPKPAPVDDVDPAVRREIEKGEL